MAPTAATATHHGCCQEAAQQPGAPQHGHGGSQPCGCGGADARRSTDEVAGAYFVAGECSLHDRGRAARINTNGDPKLVTQTR